MEVGLKLSSQIINDIAFFPNSASNLVVNMVVASSIKTKLISSNGT